MGDNLFTGLDEIDWAGMQHAYGRAVEVPGLLRRLIDPDPAVRERALDYMYGVVHHQQNVYPCTLATIPFLLRIAERSDMPGRPDVVRLLASIGSAEDATELSGSYREANHAVEAAWPLWERLLKDDDPQVREAATELLPACTGRRRQAIARLTGRLADERDDGVRSAIVRTAGKLAPFEKDAAAVRDWLARIATSEPDLRLRLVALAELAALPGPPVVEVGDALALLAAVYRSGTPTATPAGFDTDTLIGALRRQREQGDEGRRSPEAADLVRNLSNAFGDRVNDRLYLLTGLLRSPDWECQLDALYPARNLIHDWRGDYRELIAVIGERIRDGHPRTRPRAVNVLRDMGELALPAVDALAQALEATTKPALPYTEAEGAQLPWVIESQEPFVSPALWALANMGDLRALPMLAWVLDREPMPHDAGLCAIGLGPRAAPLIPQLRRRLRDLPTGHSILRSRHDRRRDNIVYALSAIGSAAAETLPDLLGGPVTTAVLRAFAAIGADAEACGPVLRRATTAADRDLAVAAARSWWQVAGDPGPALAVADRCFAEGSEPAWRDAADLLAGLGQATKTQLTQLAQLTQDRSDWTLLSAANALWRITGDPGPLLPVLEQAWTTNAYTRLKVASLWAELGPTASKARRLLTAELGEVRRHKKTGSGSTDVPDDEQLLVRCSAALTAFGPSG
jgi:HEAT repeat protein